MAAKQMGLWDWIPPEAPQKDSEESLVQEIVTLEGDIVDDSGWRQSTFGW